MKFESLLKGPTLEGMSKIDLSSIKLSSKNVYPGDLFICIPGDEEQTKVNIHEAVRRGAACVLKTKDALSFEIRQCPIIEVDNIRGALAQIASNLFPCSIETVIGVTGTCGKTSTVSFIRQLLIGLGFRSGSLGTLGVFVGENEVRDIPKIITTPPILHLYYILHYISARRVTHFAMEVTSHGLDRHRVDYVPFKVGMFTNFSPSHLDYHNNIDLYYAAKKRFFSHVLSEGSIAVLDSEKEWSSDILNVCKQRKLKPILIGKDIRIESSRLNDCGTEVIATFFGQKKILQLPFNSGFQTENILFSLAALIGLDIELDSILAQIKNLVSIEGRMELVYTKSNNAQIFVDYAHKPETFEKILAPFSEQGKKITLVFGCGGGGYKERRKQLGLIAQKYAKKIIVTDDNARNENPSEIRKMILEGCVGAMEIPDRKKAIQSAVESLGQDEVCIIAGRGNEYVQMIGSKQIPLNDKEEILRVISSINLARSA